MGICNSTANNDIQSSQQRTVIESPQNPVSPSHKQASSNLSSPVGMKDNNRAPHIKGKGGLETNMAESYSHKREKEVENFYKDIVSRTEQSFIDLTANAQPLEDTDLKRRSQMYNSKQLGKAQVMVPTTMFSFPRSNPTNDTSIFQEETVPTIPTEIASMLTQIDRDFKFLSVADVGPIVDYF